MTMRALGFGGFEAQPWGVTWLPGDGASAQLAVGSASASALIAVTLRAGGVGEAWSLEGDGCSLEFTPSSGGQGRDAERGLRTQDQLCQVSGRVRLDADEVELDCLGWQSAAAGEPDLSGLDSFRWLAGWLDPAFGFSLLALRPRRARGHDADAVAAVVLEDPAPFRVIDPRLSTTYTEVGLPRRVGLELWLGEEGPVDEDPDEDAPHYPRRAAGEVVSAAIGWKQDDFELHASRLHWHGHGHEGPGVYVLGRRQ